MLVFTHFTWIQNIKTVQECPPIMFLVAVKAICLKYITGRSI